MAKQQMLICPYCGEAQPLSERCRACRGLFEPLSRQATHNSMGPWYIRDPKRPHRPGCSYETLVRLVEREQIDRFSIIRGPTTRQFWAVAKRVPGVAHLLGYCHNCDAHVEPSHHGCPKCGVSFGAYIDRNYLGLPDIRPMPWEAELDLEDRTASHASSATNGSGAVRTKGFASTARQAAPPRNVGISSFATDEELTSNTNQSFAPSDAPIGSTSFRGVRATADEPEFVDVPGEEPGLRESSVTAAPGSATPATAASAPRAQENDRVTRSLRMTVSKQQRTIRILLIAVFCVVALSLVVNLVMMQAMAGQGSNEPISDDASNAPVQVESGNVSTTPQDTPVKPAVAPQDGPGLQAQPTEPIQPETQKPAEDVPDALAEARELLESAGDESRTLDERIADCEKAVTLLEAIQENVPMPERPPELDGLLQNAKNDLERLRLNKFFP